MVDLSKNGFYSPTKGSMTLGKIVNEITSFVDEDPESFYSVVIGSDSQVKHSNGVKQCDFVTAIVVHRKGHGARYFWKKEKVTKVPVFRDRIYTETTRSLTTAQELVPVLREHISDSKYNFEIHIDVGSVGKTRDMIKEVVGMVNGSGFTAKTKPESWGASSVADKHT
jgi:predicted RNase H-related nuclease YkuK (DUF458 family)